MRPGQIVKNTELIVLIQVVETGLKDALCK